MSIMDGSYLTAFPDAAEPPSLSKTLSSSVLFSARAVASLDNCLPHLAGRCETAQAHCLSFLVLVAMFTFQLWPAVSWLQSLLSLHEPLLSFVRASLAREFQIVF